MATPGKLYRVELPIFQEQFSTCLFASSILNHQLKIQHVPKKKEGTVD